MAIMLDADVLIHGEKGSFDLQRWLTNYSSENFEIAIKVLAPLTRAACARRGRHEQRVFSSLLKRFSNQSVQ